MAWMDDLRRAKAELDAQLAESLNYYTPPNLRPLLGMAAEANPVVSAERAGTAARGVFGEGYSPLQRIGYTGDMLSNMAGIAAPAMVANRAGMPAAQAIEEGLLGFSQAAGVPQFIADESGALRLFHGSPHDFPPVRLIEMPDGTRLYQNMNEMAVTPQGARVLKEYPLGRFDMSKIGTGEGAQAYGHGLYFAESEGVAKAYRDNLSGMLLDGGPPSFMGASIRPKGEPPQWAQILEEEGSVHGAMFRLNRMNDLDGMEALQKAVSEGRVSPAGRMYEVNIDANPEDFLDWDKPLSEQPQKVRDAINRIAPPKVFHSRLGNEYRAYLEGPGGIASSFSGATRDEALEKAMRGLTGENIIRSNVPTMISKELREAGIPGIRYLDAGSRGAGDGSRNYVIFDENLISIVRKYGFAGAAALLGMSEADLVSAANAQGIDAGTGQQMASPPPRYSVDDIEAMMNGR